MSDTNFQLDAERSMPALDYLKWMQKAGESGKGLGSMIREIAKFQFGQGKVTPEEYFLYQLYDDNRYSAEAKQTFVGINGPSVETPWAEVVNDKPTLTAILRGLDLPIPETQAVIHPTRTFGGAVAIRTPDQLREFLRSDADYPIFGKPFDSACSLGTAHIREFDYAADAVILSNDQSVELDSFTDQVKRFGWKYLLQTLMLPHASLVPITGNRVSTVRMFVLADDDGCHLLRASWKIPAFENGADNFWRLGNILAGVDVETGKVVKTLRRTRYGTEPISEHPLTNASFEGLEFPEWNAMRETVLRAAPNLPGCYFQGWDVALTDRGPVLVELEGDGGDPIMEQLCFESGLMQGRYAEFLAKSKEMKKNKKAANKARRVSALKRNLTALSASEPSPSAQEAESTSASNVTNNVEAESSVAVKSDNQETILN